MSVSSCSDEWVDLGGKVDWWRNYRGEKGTSTYDQQGEKCGVSHHIFIGK